MTSLPRRILLATDGSEEAELAAGAAVEFARSTGSELHVVHVKLLPLTPPYPEVLGWREDLEWAEREARELLDEQVKKVEDAGGTVAKIHLRGEQPAEEIVALAEELGAYLIVVGNRACGGIRRALTGSVSDWVVRHAHCPVLVVRADEEHTQNLARAGALVSSREHLEDMSDKQPTKAYQAFTNLGENNGGNRKKDAMAEVQNQTPSLREAERYYSEHVQLDSGIAGSPHMTLQESMNKGARQSWRLVGVVQDPTSKGAIFLVWDTSGFISG